MPKKVDSVNNQGDASATDVLDLLHAVVHLYRAQQFRVLRDGANAVTHMESKLLDHVLRHPGVTPSEVVVHSGRDKGQITRLVQALRERGFVEARNDDADRRSVRLHLTAQGAAVAEVMQAQSRAAAMAAVRGVGLQERETLIALLGRLKRNLESTQG